jgi:hypothetical protein
MVLHKLVLFKGTVSQNFNFPKIYISYCKFTTIVKDAGRKCHVVSITVDKFADAVIIKEKE